MDVHKAIGKLPIRPHRGFVLPNHKYTGPYNPLHEQLDEHDEPIPGQEPYNAVDAISMRHDICYRDHSTKEGKHKCDDAMLHKLGELKPRNLRERFDKKAVQSIIGQKRRLGWGLKAAATPPPPPPEWSSKLADELHKPVRRNFRKRRVFAHNIDEVWSADLVDMQSFAKSNQGYRFILMIVDVFSKYGWAIPLKTKTAGEVSKAFERLWTTTAPPKKLWVDKGTEFFNKSMKTLLTRNHVEMYTTENEEKSCVVERWNRTIKRNMWKYFTANNTAKYIDVLPQIIARYNTTYHRSIKCTPTQAREPSKHQHVWEALYGSKLVPVARAKFHVGDRVRILKKKKTFEKGFTSNWTEELFTVSEVKRTNPPTYSLEDTRGEKIQGTFYEQELQKTTQEIYRVEKVVRKRTRRRDGVKEVYVKWRGYNNSFNSWIPASDLYSATSNEHL